MEDDAVEQGHSRKVESRCARRVARSFKVQTPTFAVAEAVQNVAEYVLC